MPRCPHWLGQGNATYTSTTTGGVDWRLITMTVTMTVTMTMSLSTVPVDSPPRLAPREAAPDGDAGGGPARWQQSCTRAASGPRISTSHPRRRRGRGAGGCTRAAPTRQGTRVGGRRSHPVVAVHRKLGPGAGRGQGQGRGRGRGRGQGSMGMECVSQGSGAAAGRGCNAP